MKTIYIKILTIALLLVSIQGCEDPLQEEVYSVLGPTNFFLSAEDAESMLNSAYASDQRRSSRDYLLLSELTTDILIERGGGLRRDAQLIEDFTWNPTHSFLDGQWGRDYTAIYRSNLIIDRVPEIDMNEDRKQEIIAEARFIRASNYFYLFDIFGPVPLITSSELEIEARPTRAGREEIIAFIENELQAVSEILPVEARNYGRANKGIALSLLTKFYLNNKKWQQAAETAQMVIDLNKYSLFTAGSRDALFDIENEENEEFIYIRPNLPIPGLSTTYLAHAAPPSYQFKYPPRGNYAAQYQLLDGFVNSFHPEDQRKAVIIQEYMDVNGNLIELGPDNSRSFKFGEDPSGVGVHMGNDFPIIRYADILLSRAEALNEISGPTDEAISLINEVREVAGVPALLLSDFNTKEELRDHILDERAWEFFTEELRRQDLIRHGKFIELANERGKNAFDYHVLFPIPQNEIDRNPNLEQNPGY
ncbi:RagB/SusD family nutrient uptake outer membrane protein [Cyclobacterium sp.]|uniref:RagB/SusD family nutrient uptake outer membrane protein n=1 Tax=Cyclobacterium sp. TaxID=1966343 RepID=UPI00198D57AA|nr:RagB/SusD family nutrient uptake outer membrane protein [Cyclobacterium sp.]MBD3631114.1 RagB/SusD family nutrient uptake outer membrane protein [Cyclobacterium sp.]